MKSGWKAVVEKVIMEEGQTFAKMLAQGEAKEAMSAFLERRKPDFSRFS